MEQSAGPVQCRNGCGFYSNAGTDGLCSVCYKDCIKKKQQPPTNMPASLAPSSMAAVTSSASPSQMASLSIAESSMANAIAASSVPSSSPTTNINKSGPISVETGSPTVILPSSSSTLQTEKVILEETPHLNHSLFYEKRSNFFLLELFIYKYFSFLSEERVRIGSIGGISYCFKFTWS